MLNHADNDIVEAGVVLFRNLFHFLNQLDRKIERLIPGFYFLFRFLWNKRHGLSPFLWFYCMINTYDKIYEKFLSGKSIKELAREYSMTTKWIRNILKSYEQSRNEENDDNINRN